MLLPLLLQFSLIRCDCDCHNWTYYRYTIFFLNCVRRRVRRQTTVEMLRLYCRYISPRLHQGFVWMKGMVIIIFFYCWKDRWGWWRRWCLSLFGIAEYHNGWSGKHWTIGLYWRVFSDHCPCPDCGFLG